LDEHASSLIFSGTGIAPSIQYSVRKQNSRQYAEGSFNQYRLNTDQDNFSVRDYSGRVLYAWLYTPFHPKLWEHDMHISFGGSLTSFFNRSDYEIERYSNPNAARAITSWYWSHSLDMGIQAEYLMNKGGYVTFHFYLPLVSNVSRPTYSSSGDYNYTENIREISPTGETMFFPHNLSLNTLIVYQKPLSERVLLHLGYELYLAQCIEPGEMEMYINNFRIGITISFKKSI